MNLICWLETSNEIFVQNLQFLELDLTTGGPEQKICYVIKRVPIQDFNLTFNDNFNEFKNLNK